MEQFKSFDELVTTLYWGNEVAFRFLDVDYFLLPHFSDDKVDGFFIGEFYSDGELISSKQKLEDFQIHGYKLKDIFSEIVITDRQF